MPRETANVRKSRALPVEADDYVSRCSLAQSQQYDQDGVIDIFRQYGDHLYGKGDHDGAIQQYIKTIGKLEASYVIRKVRD